MRLMDIEAIYPKRKTSAPGKGHKLYPYLLRNLAITHVNQLMLRSWDIKTHWF